MQTNTNNVNKKLSLLQTIGGGKDKPNIVFMRKSYIIDIITSLYITVVPII